MELNIYHILNNLIGGNYTEPTAPCLASSDRHLAVVLGLQPSASLPIWAKFLFTYCYVKRTGFEAPCYTSCRFPFQVSTMVSVSVLI
jgi:hypothetical protein